MNPNKTELVVFILSHKSPHKCETLDTLKRLLFNGKYYVIVDDKDDYLEEYKLIYGDSLIIYSKDDYYVDIGCSYIDLPTKAHAVFPRNAMHDIATKLGLSYYILADDDIYDFKLRPCIDKYKKVPTIDIDNINDVLSVYVEFVLSKNIACLGLGTANFYFGGYDKLHSGDYLKRRCVSNCYIVNLKYRIDWVMLYEDFTTSIIEGMRGRLFFTFYPLQVCVRPQFIQNHTDKYCGMEEFYKKINPTSMWYTSYMACPSAIKLKPYKGKTIAFTKYDACLPKIVSSKYKI